MTITARCGIAGLDENLHVRQAHASLGIASLDHAGKIRAAGLGIAGLNCRNVTEAACGVAGYLSSKVQERLPAMLGPVPAGGRAGLGDRAAAVAYEHGVYFSDYVYLVCTAGPQNGHGRELRWRQGRETVFGRGNRLMPLYLDSGAFRIHTGRAPRWAGLESYLRAIDLVQPDGFAALDVIGDHVASRQNWAAMCAAGYGPECGGFPVWQVRPTWDPRATVGGVTWRNVPEAARCAVANARIAARDLVLRDYAARSPLVGLGGMVKGPIPRAVRHFYIAELCRLLPETQWWALGQANYLVVNGLGRLGLLNRVTTDSTWWVHDSCCGRFGVVKDGQITMLSLEGVAESFFRLEELMAANLRCLLGAYANLWQWPAMPLLPNLADPNQAGELHTHMQATQLELFGPGPVRTAGGVFVGTARLAADNAVATEEE